jgi:hypothetical protein
MIVNVSKEGRSDQSFWEKNQVRDNITCKVINPRVWIQDEIKICESRCMKRKVRDQLSKNKKTKKMPLWVDDFKKP